jgi:hypothetical protein
VTAAYLGHLAAERERNGLDDDGMPQRWQTHRARARAALDAQRDETGTHAHPRTVEIILDLIGALTLFIDWTVEIDAYNQTGAQHFVDQAWAVLLDLLDDTACDEAAQAVELLASALTAGRCHLTTRDGYPPEKCHLYGWTTPGGLADPRPGGPRAGYLHDPTIEFLPNPTVDILRDAQRRAGHEPNLDRPRLGRLLHERGWLPKGERRGTYGTRPRISGQQVPVWPISLDVVFPTTGTQPPGATGQPDDADMAIERLFNTLDATPN